MRYVYIFLKKSNSYSCFHWGVPCCRPRFVLMQVNKSFWSRHVFVIDRLMLYRGCFSKKQSVSDPHQRSSWNVDPFHSILSVFICFWIFKSLKVFAKGFRCSSTTSVPPRAEFAQIYFSKKSLLKTAICKKNYEKAILNYLNLVSTFSYDNHFLS